jgi:hypothetical protein
MFPQHEIEDALPVDDGVAGYFALALAFSRT